MPDDDMGKIIDFPMHKLEKNKLNDDTYVSGINELNPEVMSDPQLGGTILSCPPYVIGDIFDTVFWARRLAWMLRAGIAVEHAVIEEIYPEIKEATDVKFKDRSFDMMWFDQDKCVSVTKIKFDKPLRKGELAKANKILKTKGWGNVPRRLVTLFEPDPDILEPEWTVIPLADFVNTMYDIADIIVGNEDLSRSLSDCATFVYLLDEVTTRYHESHADNDQETFAAMKYFAEQLGVHSAMKKALETGAGLF